MRCTPGSPEIVGGASVTLASASWASSRVKVVGYVSDESKGVSGPCKIRVVAVGVKAGVGVRLGVKVTTGVAVQAVRKNTEQEAIKDNLLFMPGTFSPVPKLSIYYNSSFINCHQFKKRIIAELMDTCIASPMWITYPLDGW